MVDKVVINKGVIDDVLLDIEPSVNERKVLDVFYGGFRAYSVSDKIAVLMDRKAVLNISFPCFPENISEEGILSRLERELVYDWRISYGSKNFF